jgi:hypothetical protein
MYEEYLELTSRIFRQRMASQQIHFFANRCAPGVATNHRRSSRPRRRARSLASRERPFRIRRASQSERARNECDPGGQRSPCARG